MKEIAEGHYTSQGQLVVTNRIIRELILYVGVDKILENYGQLHVGRIEEFYNISKALRG